MNKSPKALNQSISQNLQLYPIYQAFFLVQFTPLGHCSLQLFLIWYILGKLTPKICMSFSRPLGHTILNHLDGSKSWKEFFCQEWYKVLPVSSWGCLAWGCQSSVQKGCSAYYWPSTLWFLFAFNSHLIILWAPITWISQMRKTEA